MNAAAGQRRSGQRIERFEGVGIEEGRAQRGRDLGQPGGIGDAARQRVAGQPGAVGCVVVTCSEVGEPTLGIERLAGQGVLVVRPGEIAAIEQLAVVIEQPAVGCVEILLG